MASVREDQTPVKQVTLRLCPGQPPVASLILAAAEWHRQEDAAEPIRWLVAHPDAPESFLLDLCARGEFLDDLGHRAGPRSLLEELATRYHYPEAIMTLAGVYYSNPDESVERLREFLTVHRAMPRLFESLAHQSPDQPAKEAVLFEVAANLAIAGRLRAIVEERRLEERACAAVDPGEIEGLYGLKRPTVWRALAGNPHTPEALLRSLAEVRDVKYSRDIRDRAQRNLDRGSPGNKE